jgi:hypothetical protein
MPKNPRLRRRGAVYYFRAKVPPELVSLFNGKRELTYSLKTSDQKTNCFGLNLCHWDVRRTARRRGG